MNQRYIADVAASFQRSQIHIIKLSMSNHCLERLLVLRKSQVKLKCQTMLIIKITKHEYLKPLQIKTIVHEKLSINQECQDLRSNPSKDRDHDIEGDQKLKTSTFGEIVSLEKSNKNQEEKKHEEEQAANAQYWKIPACCDDDDNHNSAIIPNEPVDSLSMGDEHLNTISATESDEFIKSCVENLVPNPSESEGENGCDIPTCFTTFSNVLFDAKYEFDSSDDQSLSDEDFLKEIFLNPLFEEEIISTKIDPHHFDTESDLIESMLNHDSSIIPSSSKIDSLLDEFADELILLKSIPSEIDETDRDPEEDIRLIKRLLYDNSSPCPPKEFVSKNPNADIESFSPSPIPVEDSDSSMEKIDLTFTSDDLMSPGIEDDDYDSEKDILILNELPSNDTLSLPKNESFHFDIPLFSCPPAKPPDVQVWGELGQAQRPKTSASWEAPHGYQ
nr:hypothetical protein [Tanacetum cinerariifolium]